MTAAEQEALIYDVNKLTPEEEMRANGTYREPIAAANEQQVDASATQVDKQAGNGAPIDTTNTETATTNTPAAPPAKTQAEKDAEFIVSYNERTGSKFKSIEEFNDFQKPPVVKTQKEIDQEEEKIKEEATAHFIKEKKGFKEKYENKIKDTGKTDREIALLVFSKEMLAENPKATADEIEEQFKDAYNEELEDGNIKRKHSLKEMAQKASSYRKEAYGDIEGYVDEFKSIKALDARAYNYGKTANSVIDELPKEIALPISYTGTDGKETTIDIPFIISDAIRKELKQEFYYKGAKSEKRFIDLGGLDADIEADRINQSALSYIKEQHFNSILSHVANEFAKKQVSEAKFMLAGGGFANGNNGSVLPGGKTELEPLKYDVLSIN